MEGFGEKSVANLRNAIDGARNIELARFLTAIGIPDVGKTTAKLLAKHFGNLDNLRAATVDDLIAIDGIGDTMAREIVSFFRNERNIAVIENLLKHIAVKAATQNTIKTAISGKKIVLTGTLSKYSRDTAREILERMGAAVSGSVSLKTDIVLAGADAGSKLKRANELGITIWSEEDFERAMADAGVANGTR